ncbi:MAG: ABC transporter permease [Thermoprotei archaeon]
MKALRIPESFVFLKKTRAKAGLGILLALVVVAAFAPWIAPYNPDRMFSPYLPPSPSHLLGTDYFGYDVLSWLIVGSRISLFVGFLGGAGITAIALIMAIIAGYYDRNIVGEVFNALINVFLVIPVLPLLIVIASYIRSYSIYPVLFAIVLTSWPYPARVLRSQILSIRSREFVLADKSIGLSDFSIIRKDVIPGITSLIFYIFLASTIAAILTEASLEFLGLGDVSVISWGSMLYWAQNEQALVYGAWWWFLPPGFMIGLVGVALVLINLSLDESTNPRLQAATLMKNYQKKIGKNVRASKEKSFRNRDHVKLFIISW